MGNHDVTGLTAAGPQRAKRARVRRASGALS
jgi:hypothetical protein